VEVTDGGFAVSYGCLKELSVSTGVKDLIGHLAGHLWPERAQRQVEDALEEILTEDREAQEQRGERLVAIEQFSDAPDASSSTSMNFRGTNGSVYRISRSSRASSVERQ